MAETETADCIRAICEELLEEINDVKSPAHVALKDLQSKKSLSPIEIEEQAEEWLHWARGKKDLKVVSCDVPPHILPKDSKGILHDVRVFTRHGPDDAIYDRDLEIRSKVARGNCFLEISSGPHKGLQCITYALKKFTGGLGDDDDRDCGDNQAWMQYFLQPVSEADRVVCLSKANGEAAHLSARSIHGRHYICAGSKNVHMLFRTREHIDYYGSDARFTVAKEVAYAVLDLLESMDESQKSKLLRFLSTTRFTGVFEILNPKHSHVEDLSHLQKPLLQFITWTSSDLLACDLCPIPPHAAIEIARVLGLPTVNYEVIAVSEVDRRMEQIRKSYNCEGEVLYFLTKDNLTIGLLKKKSAWYIVCRAIREKVRAACYAHQKKPSTFSVGAFVRKLETRIKDIQQWLNLSEEVTEAWKVLGVKCLKWCIHKLEMGELSCSSISDQFPVTWRKFLEETGQTDKIPLDKS